MIEQFQAAIYSRLTAITGLGADVYGYIPQDTASYPFVHIQPAVFEDKSDDTQPNAYSGTIAVHTFDDSKTSLNIMRVQKKIYDDLHLTEDLTVADHLVSIIKLDNSRILTENDGITHHGIQTFSFMFEVPQNYTY